MAQSSGNPLRPAPPNRRFLWVAFVTLHVAAVIVVLAYLWEGSDVEETVANVDPPSGQIADSTKEPVATPRDKADTAPKRQVDKPAKHPATGDAQGETGTDPKGQSAPKSPSVTDPNQTGDKSSSLRTARRSRTRKGRRVGRERVESDPMKVTGVASESAAKSDETSPSAGRWWRGASVIRSGTFLLDLRDDAGVRRMFRAAPCGMRYVVVSTALTWAGQRARSFVVIPSETKTSTAQLRNQRSTFDPIGYLRDSFEPLQLLATEPILLPPNKKSRFELVFLIPQEVESVELALDGEFGPPMALPLTVRATPAGLAGRWRKLDGVLGPQRFGNPLIDAIASSRCRPATVTKDDTGSFRLDLPTISVSSDALTEQPKLNAVSFKLEGLQRTQPAWLRLVDGGSAMLLYVGERRDAVFLFERQ